jgi:hypothetical protein
MEEIPLGVISAALIHAFGNWLWKVGNDSLCALDEGLPPDLDAGLLEGKCHETFL